MIIMPCTRLCMTDEKKCIQKSLCVNSLREKKGECQRDVKKYSDERNKIQLKIFWNKKETQTRWSENASDENSDERKNSGEKFFQTKNHENKVA